MGCWSENCAISGLEIPYDDEIYMVPVVQKEYDKSWELAGVPARGTYDDYGGIDLLEDHPTDPSLKKGDNYRVEYGTVPMIYLNAKVVDFLENLEPEFPYAYLNGKSVKIKNLGHMADIEIEDIRAKIVIAEQTLEIWKQTKGLDMGNDMIGIFLRDMRLGRYHDNRLAEILENPSDDVEAEIEKFFVGWRRSFIVSAAFGELRKGIAPKITSPQHGGEQALIPFYEMVLDIAKKRKAKWDEENDEEDY